MGVTPCFQKNWTVLGQNLVAAVFSYFENGYPLKEWNATAITLSPKVNSPSTVKDYRPISCCNVSNKCITKSLANRLPHFFRVLLIKLNQPLLKSYVTRTWV